MVWFDILSKHLPAASAEATLAVIYMGLFPGAIGYISWSYALSRLPAVKAGSFLYLIPAVAIFIAWVWLGEAPELSAWRGRINLAGVLVVNWRGRR
jgi:drug/metabolite transporter (DMT)-like permease